MKNCRKVIFYSYISSGNHGCEAIARSTYDILNLNENEVCFFTENMELDARMGIDKLGKMKPVHRISGFFPLMSLFPRILRRLKIDRNALWKYKFRKYKGVFDEETLALSTGGDIYCYNANDWLTYLNNMARSKRAKTVLWGCSIEERCLTESIIEDLKSYSLITVRESYTLKNLEKKGISDNVYFFPDPAFRLKTEKLDLWDWNRVGKVVGINMSSYIIKSPNLYHIFLQFVKKILDETDYSIMFVPHVFWEDENDLDILGKIYEDLDKNDRVYLINKEYNCMQLKYLISKCSVFMGARTHSVIAAYSSFVPAVALSYSMKSRGIAYDIFGTEENLVIPVNDQTTLDDLFQKFLYVTEHEDDLRDFLKKRIPEYTSLIDKEKELVETLFLRRK